MRAVRVDAPPAHSFPTALLRPFVDLEPCRRGPLYARGLEHYWNAFSPGTGPRFMLQRTLPRSFRAQLLAEVGLADHHADDPRDVPRHLWSARWRAMCEALDAWPELTTDARCRLVLLLHALCFYTLVATLVAPAADAEVAAHADIAELAYWHASARYVLGLGDRVSDYDDADLSALDRLVRVAPKDAPAAFNAAIKVLAHLAKTGASVDELQAWQRRAHERLDAMVATVDGFTGALVSSRFHRAAAFVPQRRGDRDEVVRLMNLAESLARAATPTDDAQAVLYAENLHPVMESRTKEALWLGDLDLAVERSQRVVDVDPYDSRAWLEIGEVRLRRDELALAADAYATAAILGPPSTAIARHMAGVCFQRLGKPVLAAFFFDAALDVDPRAISPREEIQRLPDVPVLTALKEWSLDSFSL